MIDALEPHHRVVLEATLEPVASTTFQPTGFPDLGAAEFQRPGQPPGLLVESVQSMANHFESLGWDSAARRPILALARLPYLEIVHADDERFLTSSRLEPHRLAAAYVRDASVDGTNGTDWIGARLGLEKGRPLDWSVIYRAIFQLDPLCLLHGVFFSDQRWHGNPKVRRALAAVIEADNVAPAVSGGVKRDDVQFVAGEGRGAEEGYGFVPFGRTEYVAANIRLRAAIDLAQIRGYGLDESATGLLIVIALWEIATLLAQPLRLRTACDLDVTGLDIRRPTGFELPSSEALSAEIERLAEAAEVEAPGSTRCRWPAPKKAA